MRIGIISDRHDPHRNVMQAIEIFRRHGVQYVLHGGDIVAPFTTRAKRRTGLPAPPGGRLSTSTT